MRFNKPSAYMAMLKQIEDIEAGSTVAPGHKRATGRTRQG